MPVSGIHAVTVPGAVDGWAKAHERFGKLPWKDLFGDGDLIRAERAIRSTRSIHAYLERLDRLKVTRRGAARLPARRHAPETGEMFRNPGPGAVAAADRRTRAGDAFYKGAVAQTILAGVEEARRHDGGRGSGGVFRANGWSRCPRRTSGWKVYELPPNGQGMAALMMLNSDGRTGRARDLHTQIEAMKLAYADLLTLQRRPASSPTCP